MIGPVSLASFAALDWLVLLGYFVLLIGASLWFTRRGQKSTDDYFLAGRRMPAWAAAMSVMATSLSAATFIGAPEISYKGDLTYLSSYLGLVIAAIVVAVFFIPAFYRANVSTVYQLLEIRFGRAVKVVASCMFMLGRVLASGARLYIGAIAGAMILFGEAEPLQVCAAVAAIAIIGMAYTFIGGIEAVIWTDVIQCFVFVGAAVVSIVVLLNVIPATTGEIIDELQHPVGWSNVAEIGLAPDDAREDSKLTVVKSGVDTSSFDRSFSTQNTWGLFGIVLAFSLIGIGSYGTDQDLTQRMLTCKSARAGSWSVISGVLASIPVAFLFLVVGLLLFVFYQQQESFGGVMPETMPEEGRQAFLTFILNEMPVGLSGLMMAGLFAAALSSLNSELNAMSSTLINDIIKEFKPGLEERTYVRLGRFGVVGWGLALGGFAMFAAFWQSSGDTALIPFALGVMMFAYSGLVAVFFTALFTKRGSTVSVMAAFFIGAATVLLLNWQPWTAIGWAELDVAFTWKMFIATGLAFTVCVLGSPRKPVAV